MGVIYEIHRSSYIDLRTLVASTADCSLARWSELTRGPIFDRALVNCDDLTKVTK